MQGKGSQRCVTQDVTPGTPAGRGLFIVLQGGACRQQLENIQRGHVEAELVYFMFEFIDMKLCLEMYLFPEVTLVDSMAAVPVLILVCLKPRQAMKGSRGFSLCC